MLCSKKCRARCQRCSKGIKVFVDAPVTRLEVTVASVLNSHNLEC